MKLKNEELWNDYVEKNKDPYGGACVMVARHAMTILDEGKSFDANGLIDQADKESNAGGITGYMAGAVASMIANCHERGDEFQKSWNASYGVTDEGKGTVNPAILTIGN